MIVVVFLSDFMRVHFWPYAINHVSHFILRCKLICWFATNAISSNTLINSIGHGYSILKSFKIHNHEHCREANILNVTRMEFAVPFFSFCKMKMAHRNSHSIFRAMICQSSLPKDLIKNLISFLLIHILKNWNGFSLKWNRNGFFVCKKHMRECGCVYFCVHVNWKSKWSRS